MPRIWTTSPVLCVPDGAPGVACVLTTTPWANSATATIFASAATELTVTTFIYKHPDPGAAGVEAEVVIVVGGVEHVYPISTMGTDANGNNRYLLPVPVQVNAAESLAVRVRWGSAAGGTWELALEYYAGPTVGHVVTTRVPSRTTSPGAPGVTLSPQVSWGTAQVWAQIIPSTSTAIVLGGINIWTNQTHCQWELDISTGAAGSEGGSIITTIRQSQATFFLGDAYEGSGYFYPLWPLLDNIAAGTRVSVRLRLGPSPWATEAWRCKLQYYEHPIAIADLTTTRPQIITPGGVDSPGFGTVASGVFSPWFEYIASTATEIACTGITNFMGVISGAGGFFEVQIGVGPVGSEQPVGTWRGSWSTSGRFGDRLEVNFRLALTIAAGKRVSLRCRWVTSTVSDLGILVALTYIAQPDFVQRTLPGGIAQVQIDNGAIAASPAAAWTYGAWVVCNAALDRERVLVEVADGYSDLVTDWELELGVGATTPTAVAKVRGRCDTYAGGGHRYSLPVPLKVPIGTKLWYRARRNIANATNVPFSVFGAELPEDAPAVITVEKIVEPSSDTTAFQFTGHGGLLPADFQLSHGQTRVFTVPAGDGYALTEAARTNYASTIVVSNGSPIDNIVVGIGEHVTITVRNVRLINPPVTKIEYIRRVRQAAYIASENNDLLHDYFELHCQVGIGLTEGQGQDPMVFLSWSDDGGRRWSNEYPLSVGRLGDYERAMPRWRKLGMSSYKGRLYKVVVSDPVDWVLLDAFLAVRKGR